MASKVNLDFSRAAGSLLGPAFQHIEIRLSGGIELGDVMDAKDRGILRAECLNDVPPMKCPNVLNPPCVGWV